MGKPPTDSFIHMYKSLILYGGGGGSNFKLNFHIGLSRVVWRHNKIFGKDRMSVTTGTEIEFSLIFDRNE